MTTSTQTVRVAVVCASCSAENNLTINVVSDDQDIRCSHCGETLGSIRKLAKASETERPAYRPVSVRA